MSLEQLLLLAFLFALPVLERLFRASRGPAAPQDDEAGSQVPTPPAPRRPPRRPEPAGEGGEEAPHARRPPPPVRVTSGERTGARADSRPKGRLPRVRLGGALSGIAAVGDLRRAVVLAAILGPCRALAADDPPDHAR